MSDVSRRELLGTAALTAAAAAMPARAAAVTAPSTGRIKQSVCRWCYNKIPLNDFFKACVEMGLPAVDLLTEEEWIIAKRDSDWHAPPAFRRCARSRTGSTTPSSTTASWHH
jgi:hypothetical protein